MFPVDVIKKVWPDLLKKPRRRSKIDSNATTDDVQPPTGGYVDDGSKQARVSV
jgi:hypothetical protein